jgi:hypothetical protein
MKKNVVVKIIAITLGIVIVILLGVLVFVQPAKSPVRTLVIAAKSPDGHVRIFEPMPDELVSSSIAVSGDVTGGGWFFEGVFPIKVLDGKGAVIGQGQAQALSDWTSMGTVPFSATLSFSAPRTATGTIVFSKDDPSGAPWGVQSFSVEVKFH